MTAPYTLLGFERFIDATRMVQQGMQTGSGFADLGTGWTYHLVFTLRYGVGLPILVASLVGLVITLRQDWKHALLLCAFPIAYYWVAGSSLWVFARYMVPMVPFLCLLAAVIANCLVLPTGLWYRARHEPSPRFATDASAPRDAGTLASSRHHGAARGVAEPHRVARR